MRTLLNKHALITGGGSGIGLAIARRLYAEGCSVTLLGRTESTLERASQSILSSSQPHPQNNTSTAASASPSPSVSYHTLNIQSATSWRDLLRQINTTTTTFPSPAKIDILINSAGIAQRCPLMKTPVDEIDGLIDTNLKGTVLGCKLVGRVMLRNRSSSSSSSSVSAKQEGEEGVEVVEKKEEGGEGGGEGAGEGEGEGEVKRERGGKKEEGEGVQERGVIINVASLLGQKGVVGTSVYAAAKAGVVGLTNSLANEYGRYGIRVNAVMPGYIETDMTTGLKSPDILKQIPLGRFGTAEEVADAAMFLIKNPYANNCVLNLDGGLSAV